MQNIISYDDFAKIDLRVAQIKKVEEIEGADKLWKLTVDLGKALGKSSKSEISTDSSSKKNPNQRTICAGIKKYYSKEELIGKKIILVANLAPRMLRGIESQGMILASVNKEETQVVLISPEKEMEIGAKVR